MASSFDETFGITPDDRRDLDAFEAQYPYGSEWWRKPGQRSRSPIQLPARVARQPEPPTSPQEKRAGDPTLNWFSSLNESFERTRRITDSRIEDVAHGFFTGTRPLYGGAAVAPFLLQPPEGLSLDRDATKAASR